MSGDSGTRHDRVSIKDDTFFAMPINMPVTREQEHIATFLEMIDQRINKQRSLVESLKKYKRGLIKLIFDQICRKTNHHLQLSEYCLSISSGHTTFVDSNGDYPLFGSTGIVGTTNTFEYDRDIILVARVGANAGKVNYYSGKCGATDNTLVLCAKEEIINTKYLAYYLEYFDLHKLIFGSGQPLVTGGQLKKIPTPLIPYKDQEVYVKRLDDMNELSENQEAYFFQLCQLKSGLMQQLFI